MLDHVGSALNNLRFTSMTDLELIEGAIVKEIRPILSVEVYKATTCPFAAGTRFAMLNRRLGQVDLISLL